MTDLDRLLQTALEHHRAGRYAQAEPLYRRILEAEPHHVDALHLLGVLAHSTGRPGPAIELIGRAIAIDPDQASFHFNLAEACRSLDRGDEALASYERAIRLNPEHARAHNNLGTVLLERGDSAGAEARFREALRRQPDYPIALNNLGKVLLERGALAEARSCLERALRLDPGYAEAYNGLGALRQGAGELAEARACFEHALSLKPGHASARYNLGTTHQADGRLEEALACYREVARLRPDFPGVLARLAEVLLPLRRLDEARDVLRVLDASTAHRVCLGHLESLTFTSRVDEYDATLDLADGLFPGDAAFEAARLFRLNFAEEPGPDALSRAYRAWSARHFPPAVARPRTSPHPGRIRLAYVGTYLHHMHMANVFANHDLTRFEVFVFTDDRRVDLARAYPGLVVRPATGVDLVAACRELGIDLAVDLVGPYPFRDGLSQFAAFGGRLAPRQCLWVATVNTTGSAAYDHLIADGEMVGREDEALYVERVARLPEVWLCWSPPSDAPDPGPLPARRHGSVTFGSANRGFKMHDDQLRVWAEVVARCPGSRFLLKGPPFTDDRLLDRLRALFSRRGLDPDRVVRVPFAPASEALRFYQDIDISLDTYPYNGAITTLESLWMGVPVVSRSGRAFVSRYSRTYLAHLGRRSWLAATEADYIRRACELASDVVALQRERSSLRTRLARSLLCDGPAFTRQLEQLFERIVESDGPAESAGDP